MGLGAVFLGHVILKAVEALQWHSSPEHVVSAAEPVELHPDRYLRDVSILLGNDPQQSFPEDGVRLRIAHFR
ncbi:hypothetical protein [Methylobacterium longum]|uniref:Uncharacterized protein n=1 Tax=Methylobacterium longum TaxID=767694 RepID=A0ABT8AQ77_9HYPH|nr:hypothetical protein [Methylobacterium longum]MDN3571591.1 hypothetical protein [Methylobacterium longum]